MKGRRIYLDNQATTRLDERVLEAMLPWLKEKFGNAASKTHSFGWEAEEAVDQARAQVADLVGARRQEVIFTSGATESDNLAIKGAAFANMEKGKHLVTCVTEHKAVLDSMHHLEREGFEVTYLPVDRLGMIDLRQLEEAIRPDTVLISLMAANNEVGVLHPLEAIGRIARNHGCLFHCDAAQALGKIPIDVEAMSIDLLSMSAHKAYGPKGIGALFVRRSPSVRLTPLIDGGGHELGLRSGTLNVPGCIGMGTACELSARVLDEEAIRFRRLRERLRVSIFSGLDGVHMNGHPKMRLPGNLNLAFEGHGFDADVLMTRMPEVALSSGSACTSATLEPSYVLRELGVEDDLAYNSLRFGIGRFNTAEEIDYVAKRVIQVVTEARGMSAASIPEVKEVGHAAGA